MSRLEGNGAARFVTLMQELGHNESMRIETATISQTSPVLAFRFPDLLEIDDDESVIIADHLLEHTRTVSIGGRPDEVMIVRSPLKVGDDVTVISARNGQLFFVMDKAII